MDGVGTSDLPCHPAPPGIPSRLHDKSHGCFLARVRSTSTFPDGEASLTQTARCHNDTVISLWIRRAVDDTGCESGQSASGCAPELWWHPQHHLRAAPLLSMATAPLTPRGPKPRCSSAFKSAWVYATLFCGGARLTSGHHGFPPQRRRCNMLFISDLAGQKHGSSATAAPPRPCRSVQLRDRDMSLIPRR